MSTLRLGQLLLDKYRSEGFIPLLQFVVRHSPLKLNRMLIHNRVVPGAHLFDFYTCLRHTFHQIRYTAPAAPYDPIWINPHTVDYQNTQLQMEWGLGQIKGGDWDHLENCKPIERNWKYKGLKQRFEQKRDWENTEYYEHAKRRFADGQLRYGFRDLEEFREVRCEYVDELFENIRTEGYRPNFTNEHETAHENSPKNTSRRYRDRLEPLVVVGRNGELFCRAGFHRLTIADILDIDVIPVNVLGRHSEWQQIRDEVADVKSVSDLDPKLKTYVDHPDLQDLGGE